jgi:acetyltransferase-like isoleucine patch superfamily enzyme
MIQQRITQWCRKHPTSTSTLLIKKSNRFVQYLRLFIATLTGHIPSHTVRFVLYRFVCGVDIPKDSVIHGRCRFKAPWGVHIGHNTWLGVDASLDGRSGVHIGNNVSIGDQLLILTKEHAINSPTFEGVGGPVIIEDRAFLGSRVTILPEVRIGAGAVVASGAVVVKDVEPWTLVGGVPAKFIKRRPVLNYALDTSNPIPFQ